MSTSVIPHAIGHPEHNCLLHFEYDFDAKKTRIVRYDLAAGALEQSTDVEVDRLLRFPKRRGDHWYAAVMEVREFGEPAFVERWDWDLNRVDNLRIPCETFGLMGMGISPDASMALLERGFNDDYGVLLVDVDAMDVRGRLKPNANVLSPIFDAQNTKLAFVHTDQGSAEVQVWDISGESPEPIAEFGQDQIEDDFSEACIAFLDDELLLWTLESWGGSSSLGVYALSGGEPRLHVELGEHGDYDPDELQFLLSNSELECVVRDGTAYVGLAEGVAAVDLETGDLAIHAIDGGLVTRVIEAGSHLIAVDHENELHLLDHSGFQGEGR